MPIIAPIIMPFAALNVMPNAAPNAGTSVKPSDTPMDKPMAAAYHGSERDSFAYTGLLIFAHALSPPPDNVAKYIVNVKALTRLWFCRS